MSLLRRLLFRLPRTSQAVGTAGEVRPGAEGAGDRSSALARLREETSACLESGRHADALRRLRADGAASADDPARLLLRAQVLHAGGRLREADIVARRAMATRAPDPESDEALARIAFGARDFARAETQFRSAAAVAPCSVGPNLGIAESLHAQGKVDAAIAAYGNTLDIDPSHYDSLIGLGNALLDRRDLAGAEAAFRAAIAADGRRAGAWRYLGTTFDHAHREAEALAAHRHAVELEAAHGGDAGTFLGLAASLRDAGRFAEALATLEPNLQRLPGAEAQLLYGHMLLAVGRLREGWHHAEFRWMTPHFLARRPRFARPAWSGQDLRGKTILLRAEQGMGDAIQFARYAAPIKALGATVHLAVPAELADLARGFAGVDRVYGIRADEAASSFDYYISLLSVPRVFGTRIESIPDRVPYLVVDPARRERWASRLGPHDGRLRVGLVWGGNPLNAEDVFRSLPLTALAPLCDVAGVRFYALQKGPREREADAPPAGLDLVNLGPELADFADTAAVIAQLDLVISVCTSVAHLAGALGKPLWVMLHRAADWRWLTGRTDSPWYPSARLFRQATRGEWAEVVGSVRAALVARLREGTPANGASAQCAAIVPPRAERPRDFPGFRAGFSAAAETRIGIVEHVPDDGDVGESLGWYGEWLQPQVDLLRPLIRAGATVIEVGANVGAHALPLAEMVGGAGQLLLYEAQAIKRRMLRLNLAANGVANATVMRRRLKAAVVAEAIPSRSHDDANDAGATETLDDLDLDRLDWLKVNAGIDPADVLPGAAATVWRLRPCMHVGTSSSAGATRWVTSLRELGYRCWRYETLWFNPANFNRRSGDIFAGRVAVALLAIPEEIAFAAPPGCAEWP